MTIGLFALLAASRVFALTGSHPAASNPGYWQGPSYSYSGSTDADVRDHNGAEYPGLPLSSDWWDEDEPAGYYGYSAPPGGSASKVMSGTISATFRWIPGSSGTGADSPPSTQAVLVTGYASCWAAPDGASSGSTDDGMGDEAVPHLALDGTKDGETASRRHLVLVDSSSGRFSVSAFLSAGCSERANAWCNYPEINCRVGFSASIDTRSVVISSNLDPTYFRDTSTTPPSATANQRLADGTLWSDIEIPSSDRTPSWSARVSGHWGTGSSYHWYESRSGWGHGGAVSPDGASFPQGGFFTGSPSYPGENPYASPSGYTQPDHIHLELIDRTDGAVADANYYVRFHQPYGNWLRDPSKTVSHPLPLNDPDGALKRTNKDPDWQRWALIDNPTASPMTDAGRHHVEFTATESGIIGGKLSVNAAAAAAFKANESITVGTRHKTDLAPLPAVGHAYTVTSFYAAGTYEDRSGTCSAWGPGGYQGDTNWSGRCVNRPMILSWGARTDVYYPRFAWPLRTGMPAGWPGSNR